MIEDSQNFKRFLTNQLRLISLLPRSTDPFFLTELRGFFSISFPKYHLDFQSLSVNIKIKRLYLFQILNNSFSIYSNRNNLDQRKKILFLCNFQAELVSENRSKRSNNLPNGNIFSDRYRKIFAKNYFSHFSNFHEFFLYTVKILIKDFLIYFNMSL